MICGTDIVLWSPKSLPISAGGARHARGVYRRCRRTGRDAHEVKIAGRQVALRQTLRYSHGACEPSIFSQLLLDSHKPTVQFAHTVDVHAHFSNWTMSQTAASCYNPGPHKAGLLSWLNPTSRPVQCPTPSPICIHDKNDERLISRQIAPRTRVCHPQSNRWRTHVLRRHADDDLNTITHQEVAHAGQDDSLLSALLTVAMAALAAPRLLLPTRQRSGSSSSTTIQVCDSNPCSNLRPR